MQASLEEKEFPRQDYYSEAAGNMTEIFSTKLKLPGDPRDDDDVAEEEENEEEFTFVCGANTSSVTAEDAFVDGQIKPVFPLFNRDLLLSDGNSPLMPPVKKVFVETKNDEGNVMSSSLENDDISGPYCARKAVEASSGVCKKSNSTGFSKIWRFKDFMGRCNSDGRDAFVFLNNSNTTPAKAATPSTVVAGSVRREEKEGGGGGEKKESTVKVKKIQKNKTASLSAHELYLKSKAKDGDRRRSYLPYRPELMGFFTNVSGGGLTRNVHPF
ncbi:unnamed protein product [Fraxinus pennsylvanica]|uniref:Uncharacterized protein n=1 Tax=Fraxinus pennsylvanica TaxID=56036 RepID=A0AAD1ZDU3_9LAMI|nr:unnamed protein product [Fraxinus pennsylvanica]